MNDLLKRAEESVNCIAVVTHVRNLLATSSVITGSDAAKVPVKGGPHTGAVVTVEKVRGQWTISNTHELVASQDATVDTSLQAIAQSNSSLRHDERQNRL